MVDLTEKLKSRLIFLAHNFSSLALVVEPHENIIQDLYFFENRILRIFDCQLRCKLFIFDFFYALTILKLELNFFMNQR